MTRISKLILTVLAAVIALSLAAGSASSRTRVEVSTTASLVSGRLTFTEEGRDRVISDITLHVTLLRLINKVLLEHVGDVTAVLTAN
jgi:hypothetical protein